MFINATPEPAVLPQAKRGHKYRAIACIVTADLTLYTADEIKQLELVSDHPMIGTGPLKERANRVDIFGDWFGSTKEAKRWIELKRLEAAGKVRELRRQVPFELAVNGTAIAKWIADFEYIEHDAPSASWRTIREDSKGVRTPIYKRTKAHIAAQYGWQIRET